APVEIEPSGNAIRRTALRRSDLGVTLDPFRRIYARILLSRAKHRSLHGHPRLALRIARWVPACSYGESAFFSSDSAPLHIQKKRMAGFQKLAGDFRERSPKAIALT